MFALRFWSYFFAVLESMKSNRLLIQHYSTGSTCNKKKKTRGLMKSIYTRCLIYQAARVLGEPKFFFFLWRKGNLIWWKLLTEETWFSGLKSCTPLFDSSSEKLYYKCKFREMRQSKVFIIFMYMIWYHFQMAAILLCCLWKNCNYFFLYGKGGGDI